MSNLRTNKSRILVDPSESPRPQRLSFNIGETDLQRAEIWE